MTYYILYYFYLQILPHCLSLGGEPEKDNNKNKTSITSLPQMGNLHKTLSGEVCANKTSLGQGYEVYYFNTGILPQNQRNIAYSYMKNSDILKALYIKKLKCMIQTTFKKQCDLIRNAYDWSYELGKSD